MRSLRRASAGVEGTHHPHTAVVDAVDVLLRRTMSRQLDTPVQSANCGQYV